MTTNEAKLPFADLPREDQDRIAGAIARGELVEVLLYGGPWVSRLMAHVVTDYVYRIPPAPKPAAKLDLQSLDIPSEPFTILHTLAPKPAKDPQRPRPAHKLGLNDGDVVQLVGWKDGREDFRIGERIPFGKGYNLDNFAKGKQPKENCPLFIVVSRAKGGEA